MDFGAERVKDKSSIQGLIYEYIYEIIKFYHKKFYELMYSSKLFELNLIVNSNTTEIKKNL